jgi:putative aldouronate transport system permease protein
MLRKQRYSLNQIKPGWSLILSSILTIMAILVILPIILVVIISFSTSKSLVENGYSFFPSELSAEAYANLAKTGTQIIDSYIVTIAYTIMGTVLGILFMSMYAFVLAQKNFPGKKFYTYLIFFTMLFSGGLVPSYVVNVRYLNLYDTIWVRKRQIRPYMIIANVREILHWRCFLLCCTVCGSVT